MWITEGSGTESKGQFVIDLETGLVLICFGWKTHPDQQFSEVEENSETRLASSAFIYLPESKSPCFPFTQPAMGHTDSYHVRLSMEGQGCPYKSNLLTPLREITES